MDFDALEVRPETSNAVNIPLAWAMFGGSTFILFLLCYFCQKKLQDESVTMTHSVEPGQIYVLPSSLTQQARNQNHVPSPPPAYKTVVKKEHCFLKAENEPPPSYEVAIAAFASRENKVKEAT